MVWVLTTPASHLEFYKIVIYNRMKEIDYILFQCLRVCPCQGSHRLYSLSRLLGAGPVARSLKPQPSKLRGISKREGVCSLSHPARVRGSTGRGAQGPAPCPRTLCLNPLVSPGVLQVIGAARGGDKSPAFRAFDPRKSPASQEMSRLRHMHNLLKPWKGAC